MKVRTEARREAIVEAAAKLFLEVGYEAASMNELAKRLGGSKATLYGYFPSKEELLAAVVRVFATAHLAEATEALLKELESRLELKPALLRFGERVLQVLTNDRTAASIHRLVLAEAGRSRIGQLFHDAGPRQCLDALTELMTTAMARGEVRQGDPRVGANQFLALLTAEINARSFEPDPPPLKPAEIRQLVKRAVEMFLLGATPRP
ncbi:MAG TPA: TetR/AcrR family transcriptional regulator [Burkholderiaceae bacterium]|nr:TetR/AcrR family transcriptional regulator [Burkholderiaceae bacterium]